MRRAFLVIICGVLLLGAGPPKTFVARAERAVDGDTITFPQGSCRLVGIDAPEITHGAKVGQPWAREAMMALEGMLGMGPATVLVFGLDRYGRMLCAVFDAQGYLVNLVLVESGLAETYLLEKAPFAAGLRQAEERAKRDKRGLWSQPSPERPADYRRRMKMGAE